MDGGGLARTVWTFEGRTELDARGHIQLMVHQVTPSQVRWHLPRGLRFQCHEDSRTCRRSDCCVESDRPHRPRERQSPCIGGRGSVGSTHLKSIAFRLTAGSRRGNQGSSPCDGNLLRPATLIDLMRMAASDCSIVETPWRRRLTLID
jgi:hypothetical protein